MQDEGEIENLSRSVFFFVMGEGDSPKRIIF